MGDRYPNSQNLGSAKIPSILYYDHDGGFRGIENGEDFQDGNEFLKMRWWEVGLCPPLKGADSIHQVEVDDLAQKAVCRDEGTDEHKTPKGKNHRRCLCRSYALSL